ncbi:uncharacterized protein LTR77_004844 [Saxophila tyrrhenica]|uniref:GST N-terminal domain-containing protein n=1 Tax=Saxophila tyrrhenica TaxID=1690608 RepID=A0AAV9PEK2_9PEZI|nr:hypothetical protein LTR77_004844 [Saxophila tyrrhenica]
MSTTRAPPNNIVYFHYHASPYARRVAWYLAFRRIAYAECIQPPIMPRPDLAALGVHYRRTPTMAIGRDVYLDSRAIIARLEQLFPPSTEHPAFSTAEMMGLAKLLEKFVVDASLFVHATTIMPPDLPVFKDEKFLKDRAGFFGGKGMKEGIKERRGAGLVHVRQCFDVVENLVGDGREWVGGGDRVTLADLEGKESGEECFDGDAYSRVGVWCIDWILRDLSPPKEYFSEEIYPKTYAWRARFMAELEGAKSQAPKPVRLQGPDAVKAVLNADFSNKRIEVDAADPIHIAAGTNVELYPTDSGGQMHRDRGRLIKLTKDEVAIAVQSQDGSTEVHIHAPRWNFKIAELSGSKL